MSFTVTRSSTMYKESTAVFPLENSFAKMPQDFVISTKFFLVYVVYVRFPRPKEESKQRSTRHKQVSISAVVANEAGESKTDSLNKT
jgi:S-adenosylmethionine:diacylglycerol 3-amino-3-carboxypropyl transferase